MGGITNGRDAIEFLLAGSSAIEVGTANFMNPAVTGKIVDYIEDYLVRHNFSSIDEIIGGLQL
jgi:dihydroorotate dehydrogenase (NAD+) catalytic subunit